MPRFSLSLRTSNTTDANPAFELRAGSVATGSVIEIGITLAAATASVFGIGHAAAIGITPTAPITLLTETAGRPPSVMAGALAWATPPTIPAAFLRRVSLPATLGASAVLRFDEGLSMPANSSLVLWNLGTTAVADVWVVTSE